jgi:hypothetical protein
MFQSLGMKMGKGTPILFLVIAIAFFSVNAAAELECTDSTQNGFAGGTEIIRLSASDNAHGEYPDALLGLANNYTLAIRCQETSTTLNVLADNSNPLLHLSGNTNAHAETSDGMDYPAGPLSISATTGGVDVKIAGPSFPKATCAGYNGTLTYVPIVRLSNTTNAHLESPYSGTPAQEYPYSICGAYSEVVVVNPDVLLANLTGGMSQLGETSSFTFTLTAAKQTALPDFDNTKTLLINSICEIISGGDCANATTFSTYVTKIYNDPFGDADGPNIFLNREATHYGLTLSDPYSVSPFFPTPPLPASSIVLANQYIEDQPSATGSQSYNIDAVALGLVAGRTYRVHAIATQGQYLYTPTTTSFVEQTSHVSNNFVYFDFDVVAGGGGPGPGPEGAGGDIYLIKKISFTPNPPVEGQDFSVTLELQNKHTEISEALNALVDIIIRDGAGYPIAGNASTIFADDEPVTFAPPPTGTISDATITIPIELSGAQNPALVPGQTYTVYATIQPFVDPNPTPTNESETIIGNNSAYQTFAIVNPQQTISVPDAPWWMSIVFVFVVLGWLFLSTQNEKKGKESHGRNGKFAFHK